MAVNIVLLTFRTYVRCRSSQECEEINRSASAALEIQADLFGVIYCERVAWPGGIRY